jgi:hypothetical protein
MTQITRRHALRLGLIGLTLVGTSTGAAQLAAARTVTPDLQTLFDEVYKGRHLLGILDLLGSLLVPRVFVDDVELHLMRVGSAYTTPLNHYQMFDTPRLAGRAAINALNGARLLPFHR